jgi:TetR/AcrR family transcriptional regulator, fatty acid metabolism regulator protein
MARPKSKEDGRRDEIVRAALRLILKLGYNQVTLADIAEQVGVSKGLISYYFQKKEDVFFAVLEQIVDRLTTDFEGFYRTEAPAVDKLHLIFHNLFGNEKRARRYYTVVIDYMAQAIRERQVQEYTELIYTSYRTYIERIIADGVASGEFRTVDTQRAASMVLAMIEGLILQWFFDRKAFDLEAAYGMCADFVDVYLVAGGATERAGNGVAATPTAGSVGGITPA